MDRSGSDMSKWVRWATIGTGLAMVAGAATLIGREKLVEKPRYRSIVRDGAFELRDYEPIVVAETRTDGPRDTAMSKGFERLARYIFAQDRPGVSIAMTAPVLQDAEDAGWRVRFVMPTRHEASELPPTGPDIAIATVPERRLAVVRFSGADDDAHLAKRTEALRLWIAENGYTEAGPVEYAFYNSPYIPPFLRRNEVMIPVKV